ncbi:MAG: hypothetical protein ACOCYV_02980 [Planctomycetota bacterium]
MAEGRLVMLLLLVLGAQAAEPPSPDAQLPASAADGRVRIAMEADAAALTLGDPLRLTITCRWPRAWKQPRLPDPTVAFRQVIAVEPPVIAPSGTDTRVRWRVSLRAQRPGAWALPRPVLQVHGPDGPVRVRAPEVIVQVGAGADAPDLAAPRPLWRRPPAYTPEHAPGLWIWLVLGAGALGAAALALLVLHRRRRRPPLSPHQRFLRELPDPAAVGDGAALAEAIGLALRRYCGAIWSFDGPGATAQEVLDRLRSQLPTDAFQRLRGLFGDLERLRWAPGELAVVVVSPLLERAREWEAGVEQRRAEAAAIEREAA